MRARRHAELVFEVRVAGAEHHELAALGEQRGQGAQHEVDALLLDQARHEADHRPRPAHEPELRRASASRQAALPSGSSEEYGATMAGSFAGFHVS